MWAIFKKEHGEMITCIENIIQKEKLFEEAVEIRRHIHADPELSEHEVNTEKYICSMLEKMDIEYIKGVAGHGVVATVRGAEKGKTVGIRADMDALPVKEMTELPFASQNDGVMHACGHDSHVAMVLATGHLFSIFKEKLKGNVKLIFQPAEETVGGAERMIKEGALKNPDVDYMLGIHVAPAMDAGYAGIKFGKMYAGSDMIDIILKGKGAHGAHPDGGRDVITAAAAIINNLQTVVSRTVSPLDSAVCTIGKISGGEMRNKIADELIMEGIIRTLDQETRIMARNRVREICEYTGKAMGVDVTLNVMESYGPLINNQKVTEAVLNTCEQLLGKDKVVIDQYPDMSCDDFSYFAEAVPSCYFKLGCFGKKAGERVDLHNAYFTIQEECMRTGIALLGNSVITLLQGDD